VGVRIFRNCPAVSSRCRSAKYTSRSCLDGNAAARLAIWPAQLMILRVRSSVIIIACGRREGPQTVSWRLILAEFKAAALPNDVEPTTANVQLPGLDIRNRAPAVSGRQVRAGLHQHTGRTLLRGIRPFPRTGESICLLDASNPARLGSMAPSHAGDDGALGR
jgi:hypothetical protein